MSKPKILATFDSMRYPNTGLYYFGKSLSRALMRQNNDRFDLRLFLHKTTHEFDADPIEKEYYKKYQKFFYFNPNNIDLFHFTDQTARLRSNKVKSGKKILTIHDINQMHENMADKERRVYLKKLGDRINPCDRIVTISNFAKNDVLNYFPQAAAKISVIYNGADKLVLKPGHQPAYFPKKPFLFSIGIVSAKKNFHVLPALLVGNDYELIISGILTPYQENIMTEAKKFGVESRVKLTGTISEDDRAWYYANCKAFVFPSIAEGFGLPVIEAMHFGKPVFASTKTSLPEVAGDAAYYFNTFDAEDMQATFSDGLQHFDQNNMAAKVMTHAAQYNWDSTAQQYLQLYHDVLAGK
jgi:glycosyltransferase involved in cell wall biosynthesis